MGCLQGFCCRQVRGDLHREGNLVNCGQNVAIWVHDFTRPAFFTGRLYKIVEYCAPVVRGHVLSGGDSL